MCRLLTERSESEFPFFFWFAFLDFIPPSPHLVTMLPSFWVCRSAYVHHHCFWYSPFVFSFHRYIIPIRMNSGAANYEVSVPPRASGQPPILLRYV